MKIINKNDEEKHQFIFLICQKKFLDTVLPNAKAEFYGTKFFLDCFLLQSLNYQITSWDRNSIIKVLRDSF